MTIIRNRATIYLTEKERKAIEIVKNLANDLYYSLDDDETDRFNSIMKASWGANTDEIEVAICELSCLLDKFQKNIDEFNEGINLN